MRLPDEILRDTRSPQLDEIEVAEAVLAWCAAAKFIKFDQDDLPEALAETTNILRWNGGYPIRTLKLSKNA